MDDLVEGRVSFFQEIAKSEGKVERHIRYVAPLAYLSPRIVEAIENGTAPADLTVTSLARALPHGWAEPEQKLGIS
jgi:site-specific DNA recombinase